MEMNGWRRKKIPSNHFQMKMIICNNESQKSLPTSSNKEQRTEPNTTEHFHPVFSQLRNTNFKEAKILQAHFDLYILSYELRHVMEINF